VVEGGKLAGIISIGDVVKNRLAEMEAESQAMREYIATA
jgi:CBS domain-containing protein